MPPIEMEINCRLLSLSPPTHILGIHKVRAIQKTHSMGASAFRRGQMFRKSEF